MKKHLRFKMKNWEKEQKNWRFKPECQKLGQILRKEYPSFYEKESNHETAFSNATPVL